MFTCRPSLSLVLRRPTSLEQLLAIKAADPEAKLVVGNTEVSVQHLLCRTSSSFLAVHVPVCWALPLQHWHHALLCVSRVLLFWKLVWHSRVHTRLAILPAAARSWLEQRRLLQMHLRASSRVQVGIEVKYGGRKYPVLVGTTHVPELNKLEVRHTLHSASGQTALSATAHRKQLVQSARWLL